MYRKIFRLKEDKATKQWANEAIAICSEEVCGDRFVSDYGVNILSFGEDAEGKTCDNIVSANSLGYFKFIPRVLSIKCYSLILVGVHFVFWVQT